MTYRDILARSERKRPDGSPVWPLTNADFSGFFAPRGMSASGQDPQGLGAKPASPARQGAAPLYSKDHPHA